MFAYKRDFYIYKNHYIHKSRFLSFVVNKIVRKIKLIFSPYVARIAAHRYLSVYDLKNFLGASPPGPPYRRSLRSLLAPLGSPPFKILATSLTRINI